MKLLILSAIRHQKQHLLQTILTLFVTLLITATISVIFHIASGFQNQLRENALQTVGDYHYYYFADTGTDQAENIRQMAAVWENDSWFSKVQLLEDDNTTKLYLTVSSPGLFTSRTMEQKERAFEEAWFQNNINQTYFSPYSKHNWNLLVSYGDLYKANGMYTYLRIFFFLLAMISLTAVLTLVTLFRISASRQEREYALFVSIGADHGQIRTLILMESIFYYICSVPLGYGVGILFFYACKRNVDILMHSLFHLPDTRLIVSVPFTLALVICEACVILISGLLTANRVARKSPMELLRKTQDLHLSKSELRKNKDGSLKSHKKREKKLGFLYRKFKAENSVWNHVEGKVEKWLAKKTHQRFKRRNRLVILSLSVTFFLCMVLAGFQNYSSDMVQMQKSGQTWNIRVDLQSDDLEDMEAAAKEINRLTNEELKIVRQAVFEWNPPYPFSQIAEETEILKSDGRLPGIEIVALSEEEWKNICVKNHFVNSEAHRAGIFVNIEQTWMKDGILYKGYPFQIEAGDTIMLSRVRKSESVNSFGSTGYYTTHRLEENDKDKFDLQDIPIKIAGVLTELPSCIDPPFPTTIAILVSRDTFLELEPIRPRIPKGEFIHKLSLVGMSENANQIEEFAQDFLKTQSVRYSIQGEVINDEKILSQEQDSMKSFQFLCMALIALLSVVSICGNFSTSWSMNAARQKEFAALISIGMTPVSFFKMKSWEICYRIFSAFLPGFLGGMLSYDIIYRIFRTEYMVTWTFPWNGLLLGYFIIVISIVTAELMAELSIARSTVADILHGADE